MISTLTKQGAFDADLMNALNASLSFLNSAIFPTQGKQIFLDPANGSDSYDGTQGTVGTNGHGPVQSLSAAYGLATAGKNDIIFLVSNGATSATARVDASFTWAKAQTHLVGMCAPVLLSQRARIAPTSTTASFTPYFTVSASGCVFVNIQWFMGFTVGAATQLGMVITGSRNYFRNCHITGMCDTDAASGAGAASRTLKIGAAGSGENVFDSCTIGSDTTVRAAANATVELAGATPRNVFRDCIFPMDATANSAFHILGTGADCVDRFNLFQRCIFVNAIKSGGTTITAAGSFTNAAPGGMVLLMGCASIGATKFGDTNFLANCLIDMAAVSGAAGGLMVVAA